MSGEFLYFDKSKSLQEIEYEALMRKTLSSIALEEMIIEEKEDE